MTHTNSAFAKSVKPVRRGLGYDDTVVKLRKEADNRQHLRNRNAARNLKKEYQHG